MKSLKKNKVYLFYLVMILIASVSMILTNISYDAEYQMAMAYRFIKGDAMITEMWEPHQTSAFLCAILMKLYMLVTGTTTGIVLYIQIAGYLIRAAIAIFMYKAIKGIAGEKPAVLAGVLYLLISPKELLTPEFGNMQLWFTTLMFLTLWKYLQDKQTGYLVLAAINLCLGVFSYPSVIIVYVAVVFILLKYSDTFKKDFLIFTGVCAGIGGSFAGYLLVKIGWDTIMACLERALAVEPSHTVNVFQKTYAHILNILKISGMLAGVGMLGLAVESVYCILRTKQSGVKEKLSCNRWLLISWYVLMVFLLVNILSVKNRGGYAYPFVVILVLGFWKRGLLSETEKRFYNMSLYVSVGSLLATLILSDNAFLQAVTYMLIAICASIMPIYHWLEEMAAKMVWKKYFMYGMHVFLMLIVFRCVFIHIPLHGRSQIYSIFSDVALVRSGPAIGIIADENGVARQRDSMKEWKQYIQAGDTIWILGEPVDTLGYLYEDVEVGAPTVMSTPTYSSVLEYYWEINPEKYPDVVIVASSFGELAWEISSNEWLQEWLTEEFCADTIIDGSYWRYYIKR